MPTHGKLLGASIAVAVALSFTAAPTTLAAADSSDIVICPGVNSCRGKSDCRTTTSTCRVVSEKGQNACRGQGFLILSKYQCVKRGGHGVVYTDPPSAVQSLPSTPEE